MTKRVAPAVALSLSLLLHARFARSAEQPIDSEMVALGETAAPLLALPLSEAPGASYVITAEEIERSGAANIFELLRRVPGVDIRYTPMGGHIGIRSTGASPFSEEVLLLIDGSPYNSPDKGGFPGHPNYSGFFPLDRIARIEIIKGPISVLYGANAFGGVINIVSKKAADAVTERVEGFAAGATVLGGTRRTFDRALRAALIKGGLEATLEIGAADGDTPIRLNGDADHSRNNIYLALRRGHAWGSILHQESRHGPFAFEESTTRTARNKVDIVDGHYERMLGSWVVRGSATLNRYKGTTCAVCHNNETAFPDDLRTHEVGDEREVDERVRLALRAGKTLTDTQDLDVGVEGARDSVRRRIVRLDEIPGRGDVDTEIHSSGVFLQHQWHLRNRTLHLLTGVRYDSMEHLGGVFSPRLAVVGEPSADLVLRASWSRAYRAPTWNERYRLQRFDPDDIAPGLFFALEGNPELDRERIDSAEAGFSWRAAPWLVVKTDLYHNTTSKFIVLGDAEFVPGAPGSPSEVRLVYMNRDGDFRIRGGEVALTAQPAKDLSLTAGYAYRHLSLDRADAAAAYAPRSRATLTAAWSPGPWSFDLTGSYSSSYLVSFPAFLGLRPQPSYELFDLAIHREIPLRSARVRFGLIGRNIFDRHPYETLVGPELDTALRGRVVALEMKVDF